VVYLVVFGVSSMISTGVSTFAVSAFAVLAVVFLLVVVVAIIISPFNPIINQAIKPVRLSTYRSSDQG